MRLEGAVSHSSMRHAGASKNVETNKSSASFIVVYTIHASSLLTKIPPRHVTILRVLRRCLTSHVIPVSVIQLLDAPISERKLPHPVDSASHSCGDAQARPLRCLVKTIGVEVVSAGEKRNLWLISANVCGRSGPIRARLT